MQRDLVAKTLVELIDPDKCIARRGFRERQGAGVQGEISWLQAETRGDGQPDLFISTQG